MREVHLLPERKWQADNRQLLLISHNRSGGSEREVERHAANRGPCDRFQLERFPSGPLGSFRLT